MGVQIDAWKKIENLRCLKPTPTSYRHLAGHLSPPIDKVFEKPLKSVEKVTWALLWGGGQMNVATDRYKIVNFVFTNWPPPVLYKLLDSPLNLMWINAGDYPTMKGSSQRPLQRISHNTWPWYKDNNYEAKWCYQVINSTGSKPLNLSSGVDPGICMGGGSVCENKIV